MALALLRPDEIGEPGRRWFRFDIGANRFYRFAVGGPERRRQDGVTLVGEPCWVSPLQGPLPETAMGMGRFGIEERHFSGEAEFVQMMSYASASRDNPAVSAIVRARRSLPEFAPPPRLPGAFATAPARAPARARTSASPHSEAMWFGELLRAIAPAIGAMIGGIGGGKAADAPAAAPAAATGPLARLADPATINLLGQLVQQIAGLPPAPAAASPVPAKAGAQALGRYSEAQVLPIAALLPLLPALMPLLQQVLNPQTIQTVVDAPNRAAQTIIGGINDVLKIGVQADEAHMRHLREIHPGMDDPAMDRLMEGLSVWRGRPAARGAYRRTTRVRLAFDGLRSVTAAGQSRILFAHRRPIRLPLAIELPMLKSGRPLALRTPLLLLEVKDPTTLAVRRRVRAKLPTITQSGPIAAAELPAAAAAALAPGRDWLFSVTLTWKNRRGERIGVTMSTLAQLAGPFLYDGIVDEGEAIDLADPALHRAFWHRVWSGRFAPEAKRYDAEVDYAYRFDPEATDTRRSDTRAKTRPAENSVAKVDARLKGELVYGPDALAAAAAAIGLDSPPIAADERSAFADPAFIERMNLGARLRAPIRGRAGEGFAFWAYPAVRRATVRLGAPSEILDTGNVAALAWSDRPLVVPVALNLIGSRGR